MNNQGSFLNKLITEQRREVDQLRWSGKADEYKERAMALEPLSPSNYFLRAIKGETKGKVDRKDPIRVIAEVKYTSNSGEDICIGADPVRRVWEYYSAGAAAISITTSKYFGTSLDMFKQIRRNMGMPLLRKDPIVCEERIYESFVEGADAVLFIVGTLEDERMRDYVDIVDSFGIDSIVEIHDELELKRVPENASIIAINNRNLQTLEMDMSTVNRVIRRIPRSKAVIAASGYRNRGQVRNILYTKGGRGDPRKRTPDAILVGTNLGRNPSKVIKKLLGRYEPKPTYQDLFPEKPQALESSSCLEPEALSPQDDQSPLHQ